MTDLNDVGLDYEGLVRQAMSQGLQGLDCTLVQLPSDQNGHHGVVLAAATTERGVYRAVGEAWRDLLPPARRGETLTTAEIRAKCRALREALGMPTMSVPRSSPPAGALSNGKTAGQAAPVPDRGAAPETATVEGAAHSTAGASSASSGSTNAIPAPLGGTEPRINASARGGASPRSATPSGPPNEAVDAPAGERGSHDTAAPARPSQMIVDGLNTDMINKLLEMTKRKAAMEGNPAGDDEARQRLDSYFQRAFGHPLSEASRMEGQRVIQRLAADLTRTATGQGRG